MVKKFKKQHFVTVREAETFQSLTLQSTLEIPTRKHHMRQLEGTKTGLGVIGMLDFKENKIAITCEKDKGLLFFLFFWPHLLSDCSCPEELPRFFPVIFQSTSFHFQKTEREVDQLKNNKSQVS